jgi:hypothetical protein
MFAHLSRLLTRLAYTKSYRKSSYLDEKKYSRPWEGYSFTKCK